MVASVLEPCGLTFAEAGHAASYGPGQIVTFRRGSRAERLSRGMGYQVESVDADAGTVSLVSSKGPKTAWQPARWGGDQAEAFVEREQEFRQGDRLQFTRNNQRAGRNNGNIATIIAAIPNHQHHRQEGGRRPPDPRPQPAGRPPCTA